MTQPTIPNLSKPAGKTYPAPPSDRRGKTYVAEAKGSVLLPSRGRVGLFPFFQRQTLKSGTLNTLKLPPIINVDWVMEPEVPRPEGTFLQWPTRRVFMQDNVQVRIQIIGMVISNAAKVGIEIRDKDNRLNPDDDILFVTSDSGTYKKMKSKVKSSHRPLKVANDIGKALWSETAKHILLETERKKDLSFLVTSVNLPEDPTGTETTDLEYYARVTIIDGTQRLKADSPILDATRWWAKPSSNLKIPKTYAPQIKPLIDGEIYFAEMVKAINTATKYVYIATWTMWYKTFLTGEPVGGGKTFAQIVTDAANRGVKVYILVDYHNGRWVSNVLNSHLSHTRIFVKISSHPDTILTKQHGSYHEKYVCVDGRTALVGGIDVQPDRYQPQNHSWKSNHLKYKAQAAAIGINMFTHDFMLWHDAGVLVTGSAVEHIEENFVVRWNAGSPGGNKLTAKKPSKSTTGHNVQVVKTDNLADRFKFLGTLDAYKRAIIEARHYIYIENQYFSYPKLGDMLFEALQNNKKLQLIVIIPFITEEMVAIGGRVFPEAYLLGYKNWDAHGVQNRIASHGTYLQAQIIKKLRTVSNAKNRVGIYGLAGCISGANPQMIYPHSKTAIVDDTWAYIGSANTNGRGFVTDAEIGLLIHDRMTVTKYRRSLWKEHLGVDVETRKIRDFFVIWDAKVVKGKTGPSACTCSEIATVHAVEIENPPKGQEYNGPLSSIINMDDYS